jgi:hypothetical protein
VRTRTRPAAIAVVAAFAAGALSAQVPTDTVPHLFRLDGTAIRGGQLVYQTSVERDSITPVVGWRTITLAETSYGGSAAWLLLETRVAVGPTLTDSLIVGRADLRPVHWSAQLGDARIGLEFSADSLFGAVTAPQGKRSVVAPAPPGLLVNQSMLELALRVLPLKLGWADSTQSLSVTMGGASAVPTNLAVSGEEQIRVPAGTFDSWVVVAAAGQARATYWVAKQERIVVQSVQTLSTADNGRVVGQLIRLSP